MPNQIVFFFSLVPFCWTIIHIFATPEHRTKYNTIWVLSAGLSISLACHAVESLVCRSGWCVLCAVWCMVGRECKLQIYMKRYVASTVLKYAIRTPIHSQNSSTAPTIRARQPQWHYENDDDWLAIIDKGFPGPVPRQYFTYANRSATPCPLPPASGHRKCGIWHIYENRNRNATQTHFVGMFCCRFFCTKIKHFSDSSSVYAFAQCSR